MTTRRDFIKGVGAASLVGLLPNLSFASTQSASKLVWITLRGAMDGLNVVVPTFDDDYYALRPNIAMAKTDLKPLDKGFGLHPSLVNVHQWYQQGQAAFVHASATNYRQRSHFDGQKVLENGTSDPFDPIGWINRYLATQHSQATSQHAIAIDAGMPLIVRGDVKVSSWFPHKLKAKQQQAELLAELFQNDETLSANFEDAMKLESMTSGGSQSKQFASLMSQAGEFMRAPDGPNIAVLELGGWDTHSAQGTTKGRLSNQLTKLDKGLAALKVALGEQWSKTVIIAASEFGRTVAENGTKGTDHGTANAMFVLGGALKKSEVIVEWPGLSEAQRYQGRDLAPTTDSREVIKGVLKEHMGADNTALTQVFPGAPEPMALKGLLG
ncbi:DUF1501 domain-containing protein [Vibrio variabilis]|uniref:DUF1501 domain-containing protein n=1 Tax=Vibrio variabilis TaxID=990271 RepID=UPI000DDB39E7|nr:DUF1501 domain-containing protein [Vibrio variabilis]